MPGRAPGSGSGSGQRQPVLKTEGSIVPGYSPGPWCCQQGLASPKGQWALRPQGHCPGMGEIRRQRTTVQTSEREGRRPAPRQWPPRSLFGAWTVGRCPLPPAREATGPGRLPSLPPRGVRVHSPVMLSVDPKVSVGPASHCSPQAARTGLFPKTRDHCLLTRYKPGAGRVEGRSPGGPALALTPKSVIRQGRSKPGLQGWPRTPGETDTSPCPRVHTS